MTTWAVGRAADLPAGSDGRPAAPGAAQAARLARLLVGERLESARGLVLTGTPGAGKSTVLGALGRRLLADGYDVRSVGTDDLGRDQPFGTATDLLGLPRDYPPRPDLIVRRIAASEAPQAGSAAANPARGSSARKTTNKAAMAEAAIISQRIRRAGPIGCAVAASTTWKCSLL